MINAGLTTIRVYGEPQPFPKKELLEKGTRLIPVERDFRTRKNPLSGKIEKYDFGHKAAWAELVRDTVRAYMAAHNLKPFPTRYPVALGTLFFLSQSKSNKLDYPTQAPDYDNLSYAIWNCLKRTPAKKGRAGRYPDGILFYDDDQIIWRLSPSGKFWATPEEPPGVLITVCDYKLIK